MAKRQAPPKSLFVTNKLVFDLDFYMEAIRNPTWERRPMHFPFVEDRDAANIDFLGEVERRTYYGNIPQPGPREGEGDIYGRYKIRESFDFASGPNRYINTTQRYELPDDMVATSSGLIELSEGEIHPDYLASTIGNFYYIRGQIANQGISEQNHFMASYPDKIARFDGKEDGYIPVHGTSERIPRLFYFNYVRPSYNAPTLPKTHHKAQGVRTRWGK